MSMIFWGALVLYLVPLYKDVKCSLDSRPSFICEEWKITDLALVFFTLGLVVVGWFTLRSADENTKRKDRAYVVAGPLYGIPNENAGIDEWTKKNRALAEMFHGPYRMAIMNFGRTAGFTTKVEWGFCTRKEFDDYVIRNDRRVSDIITKREHQLWWLMHQSKKSPVEIQDILEPSGSDAKHYRHVEEPDRDALLGQVFFGKITYKDVFGDEHWTTFSYYIWKDHTDSIGRSLSDDHT